MSSRKKKKEILIVFSVIYIIDHSCGLQYRDVLVLCENPRDEVVKNKDDCDNEAEAEATRPQAAQGLVRALRASDVPVRGLTRHDADSELRDAALAVRDQVTVSDYETVAGLERRVVVGVGRGRGETEEGGGGAREIDSSRLFAMSRCTGQLVWIGQPSE